jgi:uncharacterized membrane protein
MRRSSRIGLSFVMLLPLLLVIDALVVEGVWLASRSARAAGVKAGQRGGGALEVLDQRYAWGKITRDEYLLMREDLTQRSAA